MPKKFRILTKLIDTDDDGIVSENEINSAIAILEKSKKIKEDHSVIWLRINHFF